MKLGTPFKDSQEGEAELSRIIEGILPALKEITR
jgi:hypothetical protein